VVAEAGTWNAGERSFIGQRNNITRYAARSNGGRVQARHVVALGTVSVSGMVVAEW